MKKLPSNDELRRLYEVEMLSTVRIARMFGSDDHRAVWDRLKRMGVKSRAPGRPRKLPARDEVVRLYVEEKLTSVQIAHKYGTQARTVVYMLHRAGVKMRPRNCKRQSLICRVEGCDRPTFKVRHSNNGALYGSLCRHHRKLHYAELNRWAGRINRGILPEEWLYQSEFKSTPETEMVAAVMRQTRKLLASMKGK